MLHLPGWTAVHTSSRRNSACCVRIEPSLCICDDQAGMQLVSNIAPRIITARSCGGQRRSRLPHIRRGVVVAHSAYRLPSSADRALLQPSEVARAAAIGATSSHAFSAGSCRSIELRVPSLSLQPPTTYIQLAVELPAIPNCVRAAAIGATASPPRVRRGILPLH